MVIQRPDKRAAFLAALRKAPRRLIALYNADTSVNVDSGFPLVDGGLKRMNYGAEGVTVAGTGKIGGKRKPGVTVLARRRSL